jgi:hypothetical protein
MSSDEDMLAQIANIEAQLSFQQQQQPQQAQQWQPTSTFGHPVQAAAAQGFPRQQQQQQGYQGAQGGAGAPQQQVQPGHQFSKDTDDRSVFIGNLPKGQNGVMTTPEELAAFFQDCGPMLNCTVLKDKATGELKGTAYIEFATYEACGRAIDVKNNATFKGSAITVCWSSSSKCLPKLTLPPRPLSHCYRSFDCPSCRNALLGLRQHSKQHKRALASYRTKRHQHRYHGPKKKESAIHQKNRAKTKKKRLEGRSSRVLTKKKNSTNPTEQLCDEEVVKWLRSTMPLHHLHFALNLGVYSEQQRINRPHIRQGQI